MASPKGKPVPASAVRPGELANVVEAFHRTAERVPDQVAVRTLDDSLSLTWGELRRRADALAGGLARLGLARGESVALMLSNRPEFHLVDLAAMSLGAVPFSIYQTFTPEQIEYVVGDSGARIAVVERTYLERFLKARQNLPRLEHVIVIDGEGERDTLRLSDIEESGGVFDAEAARRALGRDDLLTLIYTSGTTGPPKGVQVTHGNLLAAAEAFAEIIEFPPASRVVSWLPAAHIAERNAHHYIPVVFGFTITTLADPRQIVAALPKVKPNWFFAVPRIWEKLKAGLEARLAGMPAEQRERVEEALEAARRKLRLEQAGEPVPEDLAARVAEADRTVFAGIRGMLGLDEIVAVNVGAAPTPLEVLEFFHALGIELSELWGMSETCGAGTVNPPGRMRLGTVGIPAKGIEIRLAEDGEVLVRGDVVMPGYRNLPEKTAETLDEEGWLATGDVGELDEEGYLRIVDRKKELIINAAGKNMSPANIEGTLKASSPLIGQACVIGDRRPYNTALIVLDSDFAPGWAGQQGIEDTSLEALAGDERMRRAVEEAVARANERLARVEQIKKFTIVPGDWLPGGDELTPTMKLKRRPIAEKYAAEIDAMYASR